MSDTVQLVFDALLQARIEAYKNVDDVIEGLIPLAFKCDCQGKEDTCSDIILNDAYANGQYQTLMKLRANIRQHLKGLEAVNGKV